jgi:hypothetical protein
MSSPFIAKPPLPVRRESLKGYFGKIFSSLGLILWQILIPFNSRPEEIDSLPEPKAQVTEEHVKQCQWIFDQAEERRVKLEQKAQSTFGLVVFLVPVLASLFVFIISSAANSGTAISTVTIALLVISILLLLLGFLSAMRAVGVKSFETLFVNSVVDEAGQFRTYDNAFHARGLLYCAAMNEAMNDHLAQFVKGAYIFTAAAIIPLLVAAVSTSFVLPNLAPAPAQIKVLGRVDVSSPEVIAFRDDVANLKQDIGKLLSSGRTAENSLKLLEAKVSKLNAQLNKMQASSGVVHSPLARPSSGLWSPP